mmetsp:Transcript_17334/g.40688  ORF Transcript_17334/g.40688 Transcript_17334/m.40688 type:complete len:203 (+) Transcript_17334:773-1381(+)
MTRRRLVGKVSCDLAVRFSADCVLVRLDVGLLGLGVAHHRRLDVAALAQQRELAAELGHAGVELLVPRRVERGGERRVIEHVWQRRQHRIPLHRLPLPLRLTLAERVAVRRDHHRRRAAVASNWHDHVARQLGERGGHLIGRKLRGQLQVQLVEEPVRPLVRFRQPDRDRRLVRPDAERHEDVVVNYALARFDNLVVLLREL